MKLKTSQETGQQKAQVHENQEVAPGYYRIKMLALSGFSHAVPGQFVMMGGSSGTAKLLRRPFSIHRLAQRDELHCDIELLYRVVGSATKDLSLLKPGDTVDVLGPLGSGFEISDQFRSVAIVAGGIGVAPMVFLAINLFQRGCDVSGVSVYLGGRTRNDILCRDDFERLNMEVIITTDDGSMGEQGVVTRPLEIALEKHPPDLIFACGPHTMLERVAVVANSADVSCMVSIETIMACGMGACLGCAVEGKPGEGRFRHACVDGPVFDSRLLKW
jgi:dihydroorotate dehydrogenase electron transfer subunit